MLVRAPLGYDWGMGGVDCLMISSFLDCVACSFALSSARSREYWPARLSRRCESLIISLSSARSMRVTFVVVYRSICFVDVVYRLTCLLQLVRWAVVGGWVGQLVVLALTATPCVCRRDLSTGFVTAWVGGRVGNVSQ